MSPEEAMRALMGTGALAQGAVGLVPPKDPAKFRDLSPEDQKATEQAQLMPNFSRGYKINPKGFDAWVKMGPWSTNIEDRTKDPTELENAHMVEILKSLGAPETVLNKYKPQKFMDSPTTGNQKISDPTDWEDFGMYKGKMTDLYSLSPKDLKEYMIEKAQREQSRKNPTVLPNILQR